MTVFYKFLRDWCQRRLPPPEFERGPIGHRLAIVFRNHDTMLFVRYPKLITPVPLLLDVPPGAPVEDELSRIQHCLFTVFDLDPDRLSIGLHFNCVSMEPILSTTFSLAIVDTSADQFETLTNMMTDFGPFVQMSVNNMIRHRESNLFFGLIAREYLDQTTQH